MHSDIVLENVLLKDNRIIYLPWMGPWHGWVCLGGARVFIKVLSQPSVLLDFELPNCK